MPGCQSYNPAEDVDGPAEELRAAAAKIREMAKGTTRGPWGIADCELYPRWILSDGETDEHGYAKDVLRMSEEWADEHTVSDADWRWMGFMHPGLAEPLAAWLDDHADMYDFFTGTGVKPHQAEPTVEQALLVARTINGSRP